ncbi:MAG: YraN family protein [Ruminiclostridium sp.]
MASKKEKGDFGESAVCEYLENKGYAIKARNYRRRCGEIDIVAEKTGHTAFVEVKTRKFGSMVTGVEAVDRRKQIKIIKTADLFISEYGCEQNTTFDIAEVIITSDEIPQVIEICYYEEAFDASGVYTFN